MKDTMVFVPIESGAKRTHSKTCRKFESVGQRASVLECVRFAPLFPRLTRRLKQEGGLRKYT
jgi:hypothetical protein